MGDPRTRSGLTPEQPLESDAPLPEFAKRAQDLDALKKSLDEAASVGGGLWLSYLLALFYLLVAVGSVTHADLFFEKPINLLLFNVQLPIVAFFALAPLLFLALHAYALAHLVILTEKAKRFHSTLYEQIGETEDMPDWKKQHRKQIRDAIRAQLPSNVFVQFLAGPFETRAGLFGWALRALGWATLVLGPILLLLLFQVQFLPYHEAAVTWTHRLALLADLALVWWLWRRIITGREPNKEARQAARRKGPRGLAMGATGAVIFFSLVLATYRDEPMPPLVADLSDLAIVTIWHDQIFRSDLDSRTLRRRWLLADTLVLPRVDALEQLKIDDPKRVEWKDYIFIAQNRGLVGAQFQRANLARIDFSGATLSGANLTSAQLYRVSLKDADLQDADLTDAQLQGADMGGADLQGALLASARMQGANLDSAHLQGASDSSANSISAEAYLEFTGAGEHVLCSYRLNLQGASLSGAELQGADLGFADLRGASLSGAQLQGTQLDSDCLQGAGFSNAGLQGVSLERSLLDATDLTGALLWRGSGAPDRILNLSLRPSSHTWGPFFNEPFSIDSEDEAEAKRFDTARYDDLLAQMRAQFEGYDDQPVARIKVLDCADTSRVSCNPAEAQNPPPDFARWRDALLNGHVEQDIFRRALAQQLHDLVCPGDENTIYVVRGQGFLDRLRAAGAAVKSLIAELTERSNEQCPVTALLNDDDRRKLRILPSNSGAAATP